MKVHHRPALGGAIGITLGFGVGREIHDKRTPGNIFSVRDLTWDAIGTGAGATVNAFRGPGVANFDFTFFKNIPIKERLKFQLRWEMYNAFNHTQFKPAMTMALGNQSVTVNSPLGIQPGQGQSSNFGTRGNATYDPRQLELRLKISF